MRNLHVKTIDEGKRLDIFVFEGVKELGYRIPSRSFLKEYMDDFVLVNSRTEKPSYRVKKDDVVEVSNEKIEELLEETNLSIKIIPQKYPLNIVLETKDYIVLNKPKGIAVHPGVGNRENTLANYVRGYLEEKGEYDNQLSRAGVVHRLDKGVSGLIVFAKNREMQNCLSKQFEEHRVEKIYLAEVEGECTSEELSPRGLDITTEIEWLKRNDFKLDGSWYLAKGYIGRSSANRLKMKFSTQFFGNAKESITYLKPITKNQILIKIETGRMHQIRATLESLGLSIIGDTLYTGKKGYAMPKEFKLESRVLSFQDMVGNNIVVSL